MIPRFLLIVAAPAVALLAIGPVVDRIARGLMAAPRRAPGEAGLAPALDRLGGEVVRLRSRDGIRLTGRWLVATRDSGRDGAEGARSAPANAPVVDSWAPDPREAILLLHGWNGSVAPDLVDVGPFLSRTASVLGLDFRGHGGSDDAPATFGLREVEDVGGALAWLGDRGIRRVALVGSSMGGITAIAAVAVLGDGRLAAADADPDAPASEVGAPRPRIVAVVGDSVAPDLAGAVAGHLGMPFGRRIAGHAFGRVATMVGGDPRGTEPVAVVGLLEDVPLLLIHGDRDALIRPRDVKRLLAAAPEGTRHLVVAGAGHGEAHTVDPVIYESTVTAFLREGFLAGRD